MAISFVQGTFFSSSTPASSQNKAFSGNTTSGNALLVFIGRQSGGTVTSVTDSLSPATTFTNIFSYAPGSNGSIWVWAGTAGQGGVIDTITVNGSSGVWSFVIAEVSGIVPAGDVNGVNNGAAITSLALADSTPTTQNVESSYAFLRSANATVTGWGTMPSGWASKVQSAVSQSLLLAQSNHATMTTPSGTFTWTAPVGMVGVILSFKDIVCDPFSLSTLIPQQPVICQ